jgi:hypothetical protein
VEGEDGEERGEREKERKKKEMADSLKLYSHLEIGVNSTKPFNPKKPKP